MKKILSLLCLSTILLVQSAIAHQFATCIDAKGATIQQFQCFVNSRYWTSPLWVAFHTDPGGCYPSHSCVEDTNNVYGSTDNILEFCIKHGGTSLTYKY